MSSFSPVTEADLTRARTDPAFRQKLLQQSFDALVDRLQKERQMQSTVAAKSMREGVTLELRLAELIQTAPPTPGTLIRLRSRPSVYKPCSQPGAERTAEPDRSR